jgi:hypothetical protein
MPSWTVQPRTQVVRSDARKEPSLQRGRRPSDLELWTVRAAAEGTAMRGTSSVW